MSCEVDRFERVEKHGRQFDEAAVDRAPEKFRLLEGWGLQGMKSMLIKDACVRSAFASSSRRCGTRVVSTASSAPAATKLEVSLQFREGGSIGAVYQLYNDVGKEIRQINVG